MIRKCFIASLILPALATLTALLGSYLGAVHPVGDSLAVMRHFLAGIAAIFALIFAWLRAERLAMVASVAALLSGGPILWAMAAPLAPAPDTGALRVYSKNMLMGLGDTDALIADIEATRADIILLQELSRERDEVVAALSESHPHQHICQFSSWAGMAVLSRWPLSEPYCSPNRSIAAARIAGPEGPLWAVSTHLIWPYPYAQRRYLAEALPFLREINGPAVVAGDFNMAPWGHSVRQIADLTGTRRIGPLHVTIAPRGVPLAIDHVFSTGRGTTTRRPRFGSDHYGLLAEITL